MKFKFSWLIVAIITFVLGVGIVSPIFFNRKTEEKKSVASQTDISKEEIATQLQKPVEEAWEELTSLNSCFIPVAYSPEDETPRNCETCGFVNAPKWIEFRKRDKRQVVPFLLRQLADKQKTQLHVDPFDNAQKGEFAVYCLQYVLKVNWFELKAEYKTLRDNLKDDDTHQNLLRRMLHNKHSREEMRDLWIKRLQDLSASEN